MVEYAVLEDADLQACHALWQESLRTPYADLDAVTFREKFFSNGCLGYKAMKDGRLVAFISGFIKTEYLRGEDYDNTPLYLTMVLVDPAYRASGIASTLVDMLVDRAKAIGKKSVMATYRNLKILGWNMSDGRGVYYHNNAPGVFIDGAAYPFFCHKGFKQLSVECGLYLPLADYSIPAKVMEREARLNEEGVEICFYDRKQHSGFDELFDALHGEVWRKTINDNNALESPLPVLVAVDHGTRIVGFAGPMDREPSGRAWFNGIAVHPDFQRRGIARVLFSRLLHGFKGIGCGFSTIFTDEGNPALKLYHDIGFHTGGRFAVMEKVL